MAFEIIKVVIEVHPAMVHDVIRFLLDVTIDVLEFVGHWFNSFNLGHGQHIIGLNGVQHGHDLKTCLKAESNL